MPNEDVKYNQEVLDLIDERPEIEHGGYYLAWTNDDRSKEGVQLRGRDVVMLDAPEVLVSPDTPLKTKEQGVAQAINELYDLFSEEGGGGDDDEPIEEWTPPDDWLDVPDPDDYGINILVEVKNPKSSLRIDVYVGYVYKPNENSQWQSQVSLGPLTVDWGDGTVNTASGYEPEDYLNGIYNGSSWPMDVELHSYSNSGQYLIKMTCTEYSNYFFYVMSSGGSNNSVYNPNDASRIYPLIIKLGDKIKVNSPDGKYTSSRGSFYNNPSLQYVKYFGRELPHRAFSGDALLKRVDLKEPISVFPVGYDIGFDNTCIPEFDFSNYTDDNYNLYIRNSKFIKVCFPLLKNVNSYMAQNASFLREALLPECIIIDDYAFQSCSLLKKINMPKCETIKTGVFQNCYALESIVFPSLITIGDYCFSYSGVYSIDAPNCTSIGNNAFQSCNHLEEIQLLNCTSIGNYAFSSCSFLKKVYLPNCTSIGNYAFYQCGRIEEIYLPSCTTIGTNAFQYCYSLRVLVLPA